MKFSMMSYTMERQGATVSDIVRAAAELAMDGIDWVTTYGEKPSELRRRSADAGLPVVAHTFFLRRAERGEPGWLDEAKASIDDAVEMGAPLVMIPSFSFHGISDRLEARARWIGILAAIAPVAADAGVVLTIENFPGAASAFVTAADFFEAQKQVPSLRLTFDNGNAATGEDPLESLRAVRKFVSHAHLKDWDRSDEPREGFRPMLDGRYYRPALIGEGCVDSAATLRELEGSGYDGYVNIEYESSRYPAREAVARVLERLRGA